MFYQKITDPLMANSHPGSYCGQDAYTDMFVTEMENELLRCTEIRGVRTERYCLDTEAERLQGRDRPGRDRERGSMETAVRRLTPKECERLQGFPDDWTNLGEWTDSKGKKHKDSDSPRYKALGNSIATPFWQWMAERMVACYDRPCTMGSLFDGIGGFPLVYERCGCKAVWASEIEEFPIAVTKKHFPEVDA